MDLIYMNSAMEDIGVLMDYELDLAFGADENDFECQIQKESHCCEAGFYLYIEGTEYGGIIDSIKIDTAINRITYSGRTWHGMLDSKVLEPNSGQAYLTVTGEANEIIASLLSRMGLSDMFEASSVDSGINVNSYQMNRYITGYSGITKMLDSVGAKLQFTFRDRKVILSAVTKRDYTQEDEFDSDNVDFILKKKYNTVNHLVCLGRGELAERTVIHLYTDADGNVSRTQTFHGLEECAAVYDYPSAESEEELINGGTEQLKSLMTNTDLIIDCDSESDSFDVGDVVGAYDNATAISVASAIRKKIVSIKNGQIIIQYKVGE